MRRTEITGCENAAEHRRPGNVTFADNYVHDLDTTGPSYVWGNDPHTDGIQVGGRGQLVIRHNTIDPVGSVTGVGGTSAIIMGVERRAELERADRGQLPRRSQRRLRDLRAASADARTSTSTATGCTSGVYGYTACVRLGITVTEFNENRDAGTGALISPDNGAGGSCSN